MNLKRKFFSCEYYSYLKASTGFSLEALTAGSVPEITPTKNENANANAKRFILILINKKN